VVFLFFYFWLGQHAKAALAPGKRYADIQQCVAATAGAGKLKDAPDAVSLSGHKGHRLAGHMVWRRIYAKHQIAKINIIGHGRAVTIKLASRL